MKSIIGITYQHGKGVEIFLDHIVAIQYYSDSHTTVVTTGGNVLIEGSFERVREQVRKAKLPRRKLHEDGP